MEPGEESEPEVGSRESRVVGVIRDSDFRFHIVAK